MEGIISYETSVLTKATRRHMPEDDDLTGNRDLAPWSSVRSLVGIPRYLGITVLVRLRKIRGESQSREPADFRVAVSPGATDRDPCTYIHFTEVKSRVS
jgi:hypothetical protein